MFLSSCSCGTREVFSYFSVIKMRVCLCLGATPPCNSVCFVASISISWTGWKLHSWALRIEYIFIAKYITMTIKTSNTRLIISVVMITIVAFVAVHVFTFTVGKVIAPSHFWIFRFVLSGNQCCTFYVSSAIEICKNFLRTSTIKLTVPQKSVPFDERWARFRPVTKIPPRSCVMRHLTTLVRASSRALLKRQSIFRTAAYFSLQFSLRIHSHPLPQNITEITWTKSNVTNIEWIELHA